MCTLIKKCLALAFRFNKIQRYFQGSEEDYSDYDKI